MQKFNTRVYSISDFLEWRQNNLLDISPEFQRRNVWTRAAKSFLIDTIIRGKPMPKMLITQELVADRNVRTIVDGQQRLRAIIEYVSGSFTILSAHNPLYGRKSFRDLPKEIQQSILGYEIGVDLLYDVNLKDLLDIFARINTYSVTLNKQEQLNAKYLGVFKIISYELGHTYADYFLSGGVLTQKSMSRMGEVQLSSDLLVALNAGIQTIKNIEKLYAAYEEAEEIPAELVTSRELFDKTMSYVAAIYSAEDLAGSNWSRVHWFYTMFTCVAHAVAGIDGLDGAARPDISPELVGRWRIALDEISAKYDEYTAPDAPPPPRDLEGFIDFSRRRTTDTEARRERGKYVLSQIG